MTSRGRGRAYEAGDNAKIGHRSIRWKLLARDNRVPPGSDEPTVLSWSNTSWRRSCSDDVRRGPGRRRTRPSRECDSWTRRWTVASTSTKTRLLFLNRTLMTPRNRKRAILRTAFNVGSARTAAPAVGWMGGWVGGAQRWRYVRDMSSAD